MSQVQKAPWSTRISTPSESPCCPSPFGLRHEAARIINESLERWIVTHLRPPTQFIIHEFSSKSNPVPTFNTEPRKHPQFLWRIEIPSLERRRSSPRGIGFQRLPRNRSMISIEGSTSCGPGFKPPLCDWSSLRPGTAAMPAARRMHPMPPPPRFSGSIVSRRSSVYCQGGTLDRQEEHQGGAPAIELAQLD